MKSIYFYSRRAQQKQNILYYSLRPNLFNLSDLRLYIINNLYRQKNDDQLIIAKEGIYENKQQIKVQKNNKILKSMGFPQKFFEQQQIEHYQKLVHQLINDGDAYYCDCKIIEDDHVCRKQKQETIQNKPVRYKITQQKLKFKDEVLNNIEIDSSAIDDFLIQDKQGYPTQIFESVINQIEIQASFIIKQDEDIHQTMQEQFIFDSFNQKNPQYFHLPKFENLENKPFASFKNLKLYPEAYINYFGLQSYQETYLKDINIDKEEIQSQQTLLKFREMTENSFKVNDLYKLNEKVMTLLYDSDNQIFQKDIQSLFGFKKMEKNIINSYYNLYKTLKIKKFGDLLDFKYLINQYDPSAIQIDEKQLQMIKKIQEAFKYEDDIEIKKQISYVLFEYKNEFEIKEFYQFLQYCITGEKKSKIKFYDMINFYSKQIIVDRLEQLIKQQ